MPGQARTPVVSSEAVRAALAAWWAPGNDDPKLAMAAALRAALPYLELPASSTRHLAKTDPAAPETPRVTDTEGALR